MARDLGRGTQSAIPPESQTDPSPWPTVWTEANTHLSLPLQWGEAKGPRLLLFPRLPQLLFLAHLILWFCSIFCKLFYLAPLSPFSPQNQLPWFQWLAGTFSVRGRAEPPPPLLGRLSDPRGLTAWLSGPVGTFPTAPLFSFSFFISGCRVFFS